VGFVSIVAVAHGVGEKPTQPRSPSMRGLTVAGG
jgi:hypothetical protein